MESTCFYAKGMGWFTFVIPVLNRIAPRILTQPDPACAFIEYAGEQGKPGDQPFAALSIQIRVGSDELAGKEASRYPNRNGVKYARLANGRFLMGVVFDLNNGVTLAMGPNRLGLAQSDRFFQSSIDSFRACSKEEEQAKEIVQAHLEKSGSFGTIVDAKDCNGHWSVVTNQLADVTTYRVDVVRGKILDSSFVPRR